MKINLIERLSRIDSLITRMNTGTPLELSKKLRISEKCARDNINFLRLLGAPIGYCRKAKTYFYYHEGAFCFQFQRKLEFGENN